MDILFLAVFTERIYSNEMLGNLISVGLARDDSTAVSPYSWVDQLDKADGQTWMTWPLYCSMIPVLPMVDSISVDHVLSSIEMSSWPCSDEDWKSCPGHG